MRYITTKGHIMPNIKDIAIDITFTMDNGERVKTAIHADGSGSGWGASKEAVGATVDLREALAQVVYDHMQGPLDGDDDEPVHVTLGWRVPDAPPVGARVVLTGEGWEHWGVGGETVAVEGHNVLLDGTRYAYAHVMRQGRPVMVVLDATAEWRVLDA